MKIGVVFPSTRIGADPVVIRDYAQAVEGLGYSHLAVYEHVLGADPTDRPGWEGFTHHDMFHEPFVLFGYLAALTHLELLAAAIILPQRQTVLTGGKLRLGVGVGWIPVEFEALSMDYHI
jgi:alkanesulfonate monooxygenase SsuD/methylene tetrahydromethanopterin reductase-like flavin-dependent oxidoreductase (luciferase family)